MKLLTFIAFNFAGLSACGPGESLKIERSDGIPGQTPSLACSNPVTSTQIAIFPENPRTASGNPSLPFTANLLSSYTSPASLTGLKGNCLLQSDHFKITGDSFYPTQVVSVNSSNLALNPTQPQFRQLSSFYYATSLRGLMSSLHADLSALGTVSIDANCNVSSNAYYSPSSRSICLGYSNVGAGKKVWASDDADVVVHEVGHSINHTLASTSILNSSGEAGAIDEGVADYWALTVMNDAELSEWFLGSIGAEYMRDASENHSYPDTMIYEVHDDSRVLSELLWDLRAPANLGKSITDALVKRALQLLPSSTRFKDFYQAIYDASGPAFLALTPAQRALIVSKFTAKGIHRVDSAAGMRLSAAGGGVKEVYVIDDHSLAAQSGGNCNGQLDVGETALVLANLENVNSSAMGMGIAVLGAAPAGIQIPSGGQWGEFFRFQPGSDFVSSLPSGPTREDAVLMAAFLVKATAAGVKNMSLTFSPMFADPTGSSAAPGDVTINFSLNVGSVPPSSGCSNAGLWP